MDAIGWVSLRLSVRGLQAGRRISCSVPHTVLKNVLSLDLDGVSSRQICCAERGCAFFEVCPDQRKSEGVPDGQFFKVKLLW